MATPLEIALQLDAWGFNVIPARGKQPTVNWRPYQHERTTRKLRRWFAVTGSINYWVVCGRISGWLCLDCDSEEAERFWRQHLGDEMDAACCVRTAKGHHYWFVIPEGVNARTWSNNQTQADAGIRFDVRGEGAGAIVPPSVHDTGHIYEWVRDPTHRVEAPEALLGPSETSEEAPGPPARSMLSKLLGSPPEGEGGRNVWLAQVAGHYAKQYRQLRDAYDTHVDLAAALLVPPLPEAEVAKLQQSIWDKEHRKTAEEVAAQTSDEYGGWLISGGDQIMCEATEKRGQETVTVLKPWADFDMRAVGVVEDPVAPRVYDVEIHRHRHNDVVQALLPAAKLADGRTLQIWLSGHGVSIVPPKGERYTSRGVMGARLLRYLEAQNPPHFAVVDSLGWHHDGFVCWEGVITADGLQDYKKHKPNPLLRDRAKYRYGFEYDVDQTRALLQEVLTFHDETVCAVFGAWWAACLLKPHIRISRTTSMFPYMALEAPSESGKTTGFFQLMIQLNGNYAGNINPTGASLRDAMAAHQSGIVWVDDLSEISHITDYLRQATSEGAVVKKGEDRTSQVTAQLVAPVVLSGETLQFEGQKALLDRAVILEVPSPTERRSLHDPEKLQWVDIVRLQRDHPDLTKAAGTLVQMALREAGLIDSLSSLRTDAGRFGDKIAVLRTGARLLDRLCDSGDLYSWRVDEWCAGQMPIGAENTLTLSIIPAALAHGNYPRRPELANGRWPITPAFIEDNIVWYSTKALAQWWYEMRHGRISARTESEDALDQQSRALGIADSRRVRIGSDNVKPTYRALSAKYSALVRQRASGSAGQAVGVRGGVRNANEGLFDLDWPANIPPEEP